MNRRAFLTGLLATAALATLNVEEVIGGDEEEPPLLPRG